MKKIYMLITLIFAFSLFSVPAMAQRLNGEAAVKLLAPIADKLLQELLFVTGKTPNGEACKFTEIVSLEPFGVHESTGRIFALAEMDEDEMIQKDAAFLISNGKSKIFPETEVQYERLRCPGCFTASTVWQIKHPMASVSGLHKATLTYLPSKSDLKITIEDSKGIDFTAGRPKAVSITCTFKDVVHKLR